MLKIYVGLRETDQEWAGGKPPSSFFAEDQFHPRAQIFLEKSWTFPVFSLFDVGEEFLPAPLIRSLPHSTTQFGLVESDTLSWDPLEINLWTIPCPYPRTPDSNQYHAEHPVMWYRAACIQIYSAGTTTPTEWWFDSQESYEFFTGNEIYPSDMD
jgi:hypothetical protein